MPFAWIIEKALFAKQKKRKKNIESGSYLGVNSSLMVGNCFWYLF